MMIEIPILDKKNRIRDSVPQTKVDFQNSMLLIF